jgi:hypothetical protein
LRYAELCTTQILFSVPRAQVQNFGGVMYFVLVHYPPRAQVQNFGPAPKPHKYPTHLRSVHFRPDPNQHRPSLVASCTAGCLSLRHHPPPCVKRGGTPRGAPAMRAARRRTPTTSPFPVVTAWHCGRTYPLMGSHLRSRRPCRWSGLRRRRQRHWLRWRGWRHWLRWIGLWRRGRSAAIP